MKDVTGVNFGVIIAFLLPGFLFLWGASFSYEHISVFLAVFGREGSPVIGDFLYSTLASLAIGLIISALRWVILDNLFHKTGIPFPNFNFKNLGDKNRFDAFLAVVENHYRFYQYYSNTLVAIVSAFALYLWSDRDWPSVYIWVIVTIVSIALLLGSRDALKKYYNRAHAILE